MGEALAFIAHHFTQDKRQNRAADTAGNNTAQNAGNVQTCTIIKPICRRVTITARNSVGF